MLWKQNLSCSTKFLIVARSFITGIVYPSVSLSVCPSVCPSIRWEFRWSNKWNWYLSGLNASIPVWHSCASALSGWVLYRQLELTKRVFGSKTRVKRVSLTDMRNINNPALQAERLVLLSDKSNLFYQGILLFVRAPSDVRYFLLTATSNENRELSHTTPEAATRTPEAATLATLVLPINWRVTRVV